MYHKHQRQEWISDQDLEEALIHTYSNIDDQSHELDPQFKQILYDNLWDLYDSE